LPRMLAPILLRSLIGVVMLYFLQTALIMLAIFAFSIGVAIVVVPRR
jgi:hypothetical protein